MANRLEILTASLAKKEAAFDAKLGNHIGDVRSANGQPLNDKRDGAATMARWGRQDDALRNAAREVKKTEAAIEREARKVADVAAEPVPQALRDMVAAGELTRWRKHPNTFFVPGVDRGRIVWVERDRLLGVRYAEQVPADQYAKFRDVFLKAKASIAGTK